MNDYYDNINSKPRRFYAFVRGNTSELAADSNTLVAYISPFLQQIRADRIKVTLKTFNLVINTTTTTAGPIAHTGNIVLRGKNPTNVSADLTEKALLFTFSTEGRSGQVNAVSYNSSADDELAVCINKQTDVDDGTLRVQLRDLVSIGDANAVNTPVFMQAVLEITEDDLAE